MKGKYFIYCLGASLLFSAALQSTVVSADNNTTTDAVSGLSQDETTNYWNGAQWTFSDGVLNVTGGTIDLDSSVSPWRLGLVPSQQITEIKFDDTFYLKGDASYLFADLINLNYAELEKLDVSQVTSMKGMFFFSKLLSFNLADWDVSNVTDMSHMFQGTQALQEINLEKWNTSNVTNMSNMFASSTLLQKLYIGQWDVSNVTDMRVICSL